MAGVALTHTAVPATVAICVLAAGTGFGRPANSALISRRAKGGQGMAIGLMDSFDSLGRIVGPTAAGAVFKLGAGLPYVSGALLFAVAFGLSLFWSLSAGLLSASAASQAGSSANR
jgi:hypothetical protein